MNYLDSLEFALINTKNIVSINRLLADFFKNAAGFSFHTQLLVAPSKALPPVNWKNITPAFVTENIRDREKNIVADNQFIFNAQGGQRAEFVGACKSSKPKVTSSMIFAHRKEINYHHLITGGKIAIGATKIVYAQHLNGNLSYFLVISKREKKND